MIDQENVEKFAQDHDVPFSNYASLARAPEVQALIQGEIDRSTRKFARVEQIKKFWLLETQLSAEDEELTPTMKLKRKLVQQKYADRIEAMYARPRSRSPTDNRETTMKRIPAAALAAALAIVAMPAGAAARSRASARTRSSSARSRICPGPIAGFGKQARARHACCASTRSTSRAASTAAS